jgi:gliding motility-associated-like protein
MKKILLFCLICLWAMQLGAQIVAPDLRCVRRDTLLWNNRANSCGAFQAYLIYAARNRNGPYQLLARVTSPTQTRYFHTDANGEYWYYYMQADFNCAGQTRLSSDTIDNRPPALQQPLAVSVATANAGVEIRWRRSISPQVTGYIIYRETPLGLVPIDTVRNRDSLRYVDTRAQPTRRSEGYQVLALDDCGNTSLFDSTHYSILLKTRLSACDQTLTLTWNLYRNWQNPIQKHEIWLSENGRNPYLLINVGARDTSFVFNNLTNRSRYVFFVKAVQSVTNITAKSNESLDTANIVEPIKQLFVKNVTINNRNQPEIVWYWNSNARVDSNFILRSGDLTNYSTVISKKTPAPLEQDNIITDTTTDLANKQPLAYQVRSRDACGAVFNSTNYAATIHLKGESGVNRQNKLEWTPFVFPAGVVLNYQVYRIANGAVTPIGSPLDTFKNRALTDEALPSENRICYYIEAKYRVRTPLGVTEELVSRSNTICLEQQVTIFMPNAFAPTGKNYEFKPVILYPENLVEYEFSISNRWGERLFFTNNYDEAWRGDDHGVPMPAGTYTYRVKLKQRDGKTAATSGFVFLLR